MKQETYILEKTFGDEELFYTYKLICTCGNSRSFYSLKKEEEMKCDECKGKIDHFITYQDNMLDMVFTEMRANDENIYLSLEYVNKSAFPRYLVDKGEFNFSLVFEKKTGITKILIENSEFELTKKYHWMDRNASERIIKNWGKGLGKAVEDVRSRDTLERFVERVAEERKLFIKDQTKVLKSNNFLNFLLCAKYTGLQFLPPFNVCELPHYVLEDLDTYIKEKQVWRHVTGHASKKIKEKGKTAAGFNMLTTWGKFVKEPSNLLNFLEQLTETNDSYLFESLPLGLRHFNIGMKLIKDVHQLEIEGEKIENDEKIWLKRINKMARELEMQTSKEVADYIEDIGIIYENIIQDEPQFEVVFNGNIVHLHDQLSRDYTRIKQTREGNRIITYGGEERKLEKEISGYTFSLPKDTDELLQLGEEMEICVGIYGEDAYHKRCTIVMMKKDEKPVVCIELDEENNMEQAKLARNKKPKGEIAQIIKNWAEEHDITWIPCPDLE